MEREHLQHAWQQLANDLDSLRSIFFLLGGNIKSLFEKGIRADHLMSKDSIRDAVTELHYSDFEAKKALMSAESDEQLEDIKAVFFANVLIEMEFIKQWQVGLEQYVDKFQETLIKTPDEILDMLTALRGKPWQLHVQRNFVNEILRIPGKLIPLDYASKKQSDWPIEYADLKIPVSLPILFERIEAYAPFPTWEKIRQRMESYSCDLLAIRPKLGAVYENGPVPIRSWRQDGKLLGGWLPKAWNLVNFLYTKKDRTASYDETAEPVFGDREIVVTSELIGSHRRNANNWFLEHNIPLEVTAPAPYVKIEQLDKDKA